MASQGSYQISVGIIDHASKGLAQINAQIAKARKPVDDLHKQMDKFSKLTGLKSLHNGIEKLTSPLTKATKLFAGLFGVASVAAIVSTTRQFAELSNEIQRTSASLGITTEKLQQMKGAGSLLGAGSGSMQNMLSTIQQNKLSMRFGGDGDLQTIFQKLNLRASDSSQTIRNRTLDYVNQHLRAGDVDPAILRQLSQKMLGTTDFMGQSSAQVIKAENRAKLLGRYSNENVSNANKLREAYEGVNIAIAGVTQTLIGKLSPVLTPLLDKFANWLAGPDTDKTLNNVVNSVKKLVDWLQQIDWGKIANNIKQMYDYLGGFKGIVEILIGLKLLGWFTSIVSVTIKLGSALKNIAGLDVFSKLKALTIAPAETGGMLGFLGKMAGKLGLISGAIGAAVTAYNLIKDSQITDSVKRTEAYGKDAGAALGAVAGGALGSVLGPAGTVAGATAGGIAGSWAGQKIGNWFAYAHPENLDTKEQNARAQQLANDLHKSFPKLSGNAILGILGNIGQESGFDTGVQGDNHTAFGYMQWHDPRIKQLAKLTGYDARNATAIQQQKLVIADFMSGDAQKARQMLEANPNLSVAEATKIVRQFAEKPANKNGDEDQKRTAFANRFQHSINVNFDNAPVGMSVTTNTDSGSGVILKTPNIKTATTRTMNHT